MTFAEIVLIVALALAIVGGWVGYRRAFASGYLHGYNASALGDPPEPQSAAVNSLRRIF